MSIGTKGVVTVEFTVDLPIESGLTRQNQLGHIVDDMANRAEREVRESLGTSLTTFKRVTRVVIDGAHNLVTGV